MLIGSVLKLEDKARDPPDARPPLDASRPLPIMRGARTSRCIFGRPTAARGQGGRRCLASASAAARRSASSASAAPARPRMGRCLLRVYQPTARRDPLSPRRRQRRSTSPRADKPTLKRLPARDPHDLPGPVRLAQPAHDRGADHRRAAAASTASPAGGELDDRVAELMRAGRAGAGLARALSARLLRRPAPAHRHRPRHRARRRASSSPTRRPRRSTSRCARRCSTCCSSLQDELGLSYIFISHDIGVIRYMCDRVAVMYRGRVVETGATEQVCDDPNHAYTQALLSAIPHPDPRAAACTSATATPAADPAGRLAAKETAGHEDHRHHALS